jgi:hypothetical protein
MSRLRIATILFGSALLASAALGCVAPPNEDVGQDDQDLRRRRRRDSGADAQTDAGNADARADADAGSDPPDSSIDCSANPPTNLACSGLYADFATRTLAPGVRAYDPALHLWSDGALKQRYVWLPPGSQIDTSNMDEWIFPVGTRFWKEFRLGGRLIETRFMWKWANNDWFRTTYRWSSDETSATELTTGEQNVNGTTYEVPPQEMCSWCHRGRQDNALGFEALSLGLPGATGLNVETLVQEGLLTNPPTSALAIPGDPAEALALGWLHANCGTACHNENPNALANWTGLRMRLDVSALATVVGTDTYQTAVGVRPNATPGLVGDWFRIKPGDPDFSVIYYRDNRRDQNPEVDRTQMPPFATHTIDTAGVAAVRAWILAL